MNTHKRWRVEILINDDDHKTQAHARLDTHDDLHTHGQGSARRSPIDTNPSQIRDQLAAARALSELANKLAARAGRDLQADHAWSGPRSVRWRPGGLETSRGDGGMSVRDAATGSGGDPGGASAEHTMAAR
jgi:hypothetical protein